MNDRTCRKCGAIAKSVEVEQSVPQFGPDPVDCVFDQPIVTSRTIVYACGSREYKNGWLHSNECVRRDRQHPYKQVLDLQRKLADAEREIEHLSSVIHSKTEHDFRINALITHGEEVAEIVRRDRKREGRSGPHVYLDMWDQAVAFARRTTK